MIPNTEASSDTQTQPLSVCVINNIYPPFHRGGAEQVVVKTVEGLIAAGHRVILITSTPEEEHVETQGRLTIYRIHPKNVYFYTQAEHYHPLVRLLWHVVNVFHLSVASTIQGILQKEQPTIVHTHNLMGLSFFIPRMIRRLGIAHVHTVHDVQLVEPSGIILKEKEHTWRYTGWHSRIYTALVRGLFGSPHVVISPSKFLLKLYQERGFFSHSRTVLVRNPLTFQSVLPPQSRSHTKEVKYIYVGQIESHKGITLLIDAFMRINNPHIRLHVVGNGSLLAEIKKQSAPDSRITVYGRLERESLAALFMRMDMTIVPSLCYENSPTVIFESFSFGIPVLASNVEGIAELIEEGNNGMTFQPGNSASLEEKMLWSIEHRSEIAAMGKNTQRFLREITKEEYLTELLALYRGCI